LSVTAAPEADAGGAQAVAAVGIAEAPLLFSRAVRLATETKHAAARAACRIGGARFAVRHASASALPTDALARTVAAIGVDRARASPRPAPLGPAGADVEAANGATPTVLRRALTQVDAIACARVPEANTRPVAAIEVCLTSFAGRRAARGAAGAYRLGRPLRRTATGVGITGGPAIGAGNGAGTGIEAASARAGAALLVASAGVALGTADGDAGSGPAGLAVLAVQVGAAVDEAEVSVLA
jgi:hypothetical protein